MRKYWILGLIGITGLLNAATINMAPDTVYVKTPTATNNPTTKKYVDDLVVSATTGKVDAASLGTILSGYVATNDSRLTDARAPVAHSQPAASITNAPWLTSLNGAMTNLTLNNNAPSGTTFVNGTLSLGTNAAAGGWTTNQPFVATLVWTNAGASRTTTNSGLITAIINTNAGLTSVKGSIGTTVDGAGSVISTGVVSQVIIPYAMTMTKWMLVADQSGSVVMDIKVNGTSTIGAGNAPTLSSATTNSAAISSWTSVALNEGDIVEYVVSSATTLTRVSLVIKTTHQ